MVNIKSTRRAFGFFLPSEYADMYMCYQRGVVVLGVWSILPFIIKHIFPCTFGNKCMRLITRVYGSTRTSLYSTSRCHYCKLNCEAIGIPQEGEPCNEKITQVLHSDRQYQLPEILLEPPMDR